MTANKTSQRLCLVPAHLHWIYNVFITKSLGLLFKYKYYVPLITLYDHNEDYVVASSCSVQV